MPELAGWETFYVIVGFVLIGIHNALETVTYVAVSQPEKADRG